MPVAAPPIDPAAFITANLTLRPVTADPGIRLFTAHPGSGLRRLVGDGPAAPYWAYPWAGGLVLARYLHENPETVARRSVLDLGAGSGLVAIAAARAGARKVIAAETDPFGRAALALNADANGVTLEIVAEDFLPSAPPPVEIVLVGDLFYAARLARRVTAFLDRCLVAGIDVLVGDPGRAHLPLDRLRPLARYEIADFGSASTAPMAGAGVYRFKGK